MMSLQWWNVPSVANLWGTPSGDLTALAGFIQGEAGNQGVAGMDAVAGVFQNRVNENFNGYGADFQSQLMANSQFQGWAQPSQNAYTVAQNLQNGNLQDPTSGATYYANPAFSTPGNWGSRLNSGNSLQIGDHFFTDNTNGIPFSGAGSGLTDAQFSARYGAANATQDAAQNAAWGDPSNTPAAPDYSQPSGNYGLPQGYDGGQIAPANTITQMTPDQSDRYGRRHER
jgi:hypothetical protein